MENLFAQPGWKTFIDDVRGWQEAVDTQWRGVSDARGLFIAQGRYHGFEQIIKFQQMCETLKAQAIDDAEDSDV